MRSEISNVGGVTFPAFTGTRWMMMPFRMDDVETVPEHYRPTAAQLVALSGRRDGVGYLTVDESQITAGETHRRPGLHVDGVGSWGGGGAWSGCGMLLASTTIGCHGWDQDFDGDPADDGDCEHLRHMLRPERRIIMLPHNVYACNRTAVHESLPQSHNGARQFVRLSMPSPFPWFEGYTESPCGVQPSGPILPRRAEQMAYRQ